MQAMDAFKLLLFNLSSSLIGIINNVTYMSKQTLGCSISSSLIGIISLIITYKNGWMVCARPVVAAPTR
jgi:hypothetical protein